MRTCQLRADIMCIIGVSDSSSFSNIRHSETRLQPSSQQGAIAAGRYGVNASSTDRTGAMYGVVPTKSELSRTIRSAEHQQFVQLHNTDIAPQDVEQDSCLVGFGLIYP